jgi:c-di-GMP-binding flagellar brake protein YcgR
VLISNNTYQHCSDSVTIGTVYKVHPKGRQNTIDIYELTSINTPVRLQVPKLTRRRFLRVDVQFGIKFNIVEDKRLSETIHNGVCVDISYSSIGITTSQPLTLLTEIRIVLSFSMLGPDVREIYAKVVRVREKDGVYHAGLEFTSIDDQSLDTIKAYIDTAVAGH